jgi:uncharacterized repeat protein (TIGR03803 family)
MEIARNPRCDFDFRNAVRVTPEEDAIMPRKKPILFIVASAFVLCLTVVAPALAATKERVLYSFCKAQLCPDGSNPTSSLVMDAAGNLYGTAIYGGNSNCVHGCGTVFELARGNGKWAYKVLHHFESNGKDGYYPEANLIFDAAGNLYGTTVEGGTFQTGTVFELMPAKDGKWEEKILHSFAGNSSDGSEPLAPVVFDATGNLYGTNFYEGAYGDGTVFKLTPVKNGDWTETVLHSFDFNGEDGFSPRAGVVLDGSGNLYGTTILGGAGGNGIVFEEKHGKNGSWKENLLYSFTGGVDGGLADAPLVFDSSGSLYSTTLAGGSRGLGNVFKLTRNAKGKWELTTLYSFENFGGVYPESGVIFDRSGNLYGTTSEGGPYDAGTVFELMPGSGGTWTETELHSFGNGRDGSTPDAGLIVDASGNLYGTTNAGGTYGYGTVFEITSGH